MKIKIQKVMTIFRAIAGSMVLGSVLFVGLPVTETHAFCSSGNGSSQYVAIPLRKDWGREEAQYSSTCDYDGIYKGRVRDLLTDGKYVHVRLASRRDMSNEFSHTYTGQSRNFTMWGSWHMRICKSGTPLGVGKSDSRCSAVVYAGT